MGAAGTIRQMHQPVGSRVLALFSGDTHVIARRVFETDFCLVVQSNAVPSAAVIIAVLLGLLGGLVNGLRAVVPILVDLMPDSIYRRYLIDTGRFCACLIIFFFFLLLVL